MALVETTVRRQAFLMTVFTDDMNMKSAVDVNSDDGTSVALLSDQLHRWLLWTNGSAVQDDANGLTAQQTMIPLGRRYKIASFASSVVLDKTTAVASLPNATLLVGQTSKRVVQFAWSMGHRVDNWLELLGIQLAFTTTNLIVFAADFYLTHQGLHGFQKPILSCDLSAGTERRKFVMLVSVLNCMLSAHYINVGCIYYGTTFGSLVFLASSLVLATCWETMAHVMLAFVSCIPSPFDHVVTYISRLFVFGTIGLLPFVFWWQYPAVSASFRAAPFGLALNIHGTLRSSGAYTAEPVPTSAIRMVPYCFLTMVFIAVMAVVESMGRRKLTQGVFLLDLSWTKSNQHDAFHQDWESIVRQAKRPSHPRLCLHGRKEKSYLTAIRVDRGQAAASEKDSLRRLSVCSYPDAAWAPQRLPEWLALQPFGSVDDKNVFHPTAAVSFGRNLFRHDRGVCV
ncbi:hypothetical protein AC1031_019944 [Aphanomyces cochlioides]|nr:hypothetical protein AC1031_019944 [Aphanomyces cochlioides]